MRFSVADTPLKDAPDKRSPWSRESLDIDADSANTSQIFQRALPQRNNFNHDQTSFLCHELKKMQNLSPIERSTARQQRHTINRWCWRVGTHYRTNERSSSKLALETPENWYC
jgi:hypothetical protein